MALTTLANVKLLLGITGNAQDLQIIALINSASARIENWCNRKFGAQDCTEWHDGGWAVVARRSPINSITRIGINDGTYFNVAYNGPDAWARVDVTAGLNSTVGSLRLTRSGGVPVIITFDNKMVSDVLDAINGTPNWQAYNNGQVINGKASWIPPMAGLDVTLNPTDVGNGGGPAAIPVCMGELPLSRYEADSGVVEITNDGQIFQLGIVGGFSLGGQTFGGWGLNPTTAWSTNNDSTLNFPRIYQGIVLDYNGGLNPIPDDVQQTCVDMVQYMLQQSSNNSMLLGGEALGGYSYTNALSGGGGGRFSPKGGIAGTLSGMDALIKERLAGYYRFPLSV